MLYKRLERGTFAWPADEAVARVELRGADLLLLLSGVDSATRVGDGGTSAWHEAPETPRRGCRTVHQLMESPLEPAALDDLSATARALITTLHDQVRTLQRENAALRQQLDVLCQLIGVGQAV